jgi:hypothetical protein
MVFHSVFVLMLSKEQRMYYVQCPRCGAPIDIPDDAVGPDRDDLWNVAQCNECDSAFDYDDEEVVFVPDDTSSSV